MVSFLTEELFPVVCNMSVTAGVIIIFVLLARLLLKKAPKVFSYALWAVVLFRLLCPVSMTASFSLLSLLNTPVKESSALTSTVEYVRPNIDHAEIPQVHLPVPGVSETFNDTPPQGQAQPAANSPETFVSVTAYIWLGGILAMLLYSVVSLLLLRRKLLGAAPMHGNIYVADYIGSPFVMGLLRPKIYLPSSLSEQEREYIILHEQYHIHRLDHIVKILAFAALCIHWFNPLVWAAFFLSGKDMEMSCDEAVVKKLGEGIRADYSASLLSLATGRRIIAGTPLAFGEGDTKGRILNLLNWKKPKPWLITLGAVACVAVIAACAANPVGKQEAVPDTVPDDLTGQYASMEEFARKTMAKAETVTYYSAAEMQTGEDAMETANVLDTKLAWLDKEGEVEKLAPEGVLEAWKFNYYVRIDTEPENVALVGGMHEEDGYFDLEGQGGHNIVALRYADGSYDILYDQAVNDGLDFYGYHNSYEEAIYDWYVTEYGLDLPLYVISLLTDDELGHYPARRYDGDGWYIYIPISGWSATEVWSRWDSLYGTGAFLQVQKCSDGMEDIKAYYGALGAWPCETDMSSPFDSYYLLAPQGGDAQNEMFFVPESDTSSYTITCTWAKSTLREEEVPILHAMAASFTVDAAFAAPPVVEPADTDRVERMVNGIFVGSLSYDESWPNPGGYTLTASDSTGRVDTYTVLPLPYYSLDSTPGHRLVSDFDWAAAEASGAEGYEENGDTFRFTNDTYSVTVYSHRNLLRLEENGKATILAATPHSPNADSALSELFRSFLQYAEEAEDEYTRSVVCSVDGSETDYAVIAQKLAQQYAQRILDRPGWCRHPAQDVKVDATNVFDAYYGGNNPNFCFGMGLYLKLSEDQTNFWEAGSGLSDVPEGDPYAGYYGWGREVNADKGADGNWHITGMGTGGAGVFLPYALEGATTQQLMELYFLTSGKTHDFLLPYKLAEKPLEEVRTQLSALETAQRREMKDGILDFAANYPDYCTWSASDFE